MSDWTPLASGAFPAAERSVILAASEVVLKLSKGESADHEHDIIRARHETSLQL
jgi:hypothetical protein